MAITLYGLKNCDTCKKAIKALEAANHTVDFVDIRAEADLATKVPTWLDAVGSDSLINRRSTTWRNLSEAERDGEAKTQLIENPTLIKRPVIEAGSTLYVGWTKAVQDAVL
ncbi:MAG: ArsC/Spx/MgsR family protein [Pseudomonadota bacterium]